MTLACASSLPPSFGGLAVPLWTSATFSSPKAETTTTSPLHFRRLWTRGGSLITFHLIFVFSTYSDDGCSPHFHSLKPLVGFLKSASSSNKPLRLHCPTPACYTGGGRPPTARAMAHSYDVGTRAWQPDPTEGWVASEVESKKVQGEKVILVFQLDNGEV